MANVVSFSANNAMVTVIETDGTEHTLPSVTAYVESGGERSVSEEQTFSGPATTAEAPGKPSIQIDGLYAPHVNGWKVLSQAFNDGTNVRIRLKTEELEVFSTSAQGDTAAIATTGVVTFAGNKPDFSSDEYGTGHALKIGTKYYVIQSIVKGSGANSYTVTVDAPATAVTAANYSIVVPSLIRGPFACQVTLSDRFDLSVGQSMRGSATLTPSAIALPEVRVGV